MEVIFIQTQTFFGADTELHVQLMRYFDRSVVGVHVALSQSTHGAIDHRKVIEGIDNISIVPMSFGARTRSRVLNAVIRPLILMRAIAQLRRYIRQKSISVIHATEKPRDVVTAVILGKLTGARSIIHAHVSYGDWMSPIVKLSLRHADAIIAVSDFSRRSFVDSGVVPEGRAYKVLNSLDVVSGRWESGDRAAVRHEYGIEAEQLLLGVVSRLFSYKGHLELLEGLSQVDDRMPDYRLLIVGDDDPGSDANGEVFSDRIRATAERLGLSNRIMFAGFRTDVPDLMAAFDVYTMPSWEEPFGMVYLEAMALRRPVVAWNQAGPAEIVLDGVTGFLVSPKDVAALGEAILQLAGDRAMRERFGAAGRQRAMTAFNSDRFCRDVLEVYEQALRTPKRGVRVRSGNRKGVAVA